MKFIFHTTFFFLFLFICYKDAQIVNGKFLPIPNVFASRFVWLTLIDLYMQTAYHFVGIIISVFHGGKNNTWFDYWGRAIAGPIGFAVTVLFWTLYIADPGTLAKDEVARQILSIIWYNHGLHTLPMVSAHLDLLVWQHRRFSTKHVLQGISVFVTLYLIDLHVVHYISNFWAYPILGKLEFPARMGFFAVCIVVVYLAYLWLALIDKLLYGSGKKAKKSKSP